MRQMVSGCSPREWPFHISTFSESIFKKKTKCNRFARARARMRTPKKKTLVLRWKILHVRCRHQKSRIASRISSFFINLQELHNSYAYCMQSIERLKKFTSNASTHARRFWVATTLAQHSAAIAAGTTKYVADALLYQVLYVALPLAVPWVRNKNQPLHAFRIYISSDWVHT